VIREKDVTAVGIVASRPCPLCGYPQVGFITGDGVFHLLRPGTLVRVLEDLDKPFPDGPVEKAEPQEISVPGKEGATSFGVWVPSPVRAHKALRLKYGVTLSEDLLAEKIPFPLYQMAYVDKLRRLIEKEIYVPVPVMLDRFFNAPYLASGDPKEIAEAMWHELKEIREPALAVEKWLEGGAPDTLLSFRTTRNQGTPALDEVSGQEDLTREQETLSLEEFLELL
jgi:hypothetical protein